MRFDEFDYHLPEELIAQEPCSRRDASRLMLLDRRQARLAEAVFTDITRHINPGDLLVLNDTRVIPARLFGRKESGGRIEVLLVRKCEGDGATWTCLLKCSKKPMPGSKLVFPGGMTGQVICRNPDETWLVSFLAEEIFGQWLEEQGSMPLPPYIRRQVEPCDRHRYQTVFASSSGAVAAPTAGLHFTEELLEAVQRKGAVIAPVTLHVGLGTFLPVRVEHVHEHRMHREYYTIPPETVAAIEQCTARGGRVIALGTTTARALEHSASTHGSIVPGPGEADIFIYPGYRFKVVEALITNFHLPCSTLLLLVAAFAGKEFLLHAYKEAVDRKFRFFSYGDAMFIY